MVKMFYRMSLTVPETQKKVSGNFTKVWEKNIKK